MIISRAILLVEDYFVGECVVGGTTDGTESSDVSSKSGTVSLCRSPAFFPYIW